VKSDINPVETIAIRAIEPEYKFIIAVEPLTERELEVLQLIVDGYSNIAIAREFYITVGTVKTHVRSFAENSVLRTELRQRFEHSAPVSTKWKE